MIEEDDFEFIRRRTKELMPKTAAFYKRVDKATKEWSAALNKLLPLLVSIENEFQEDQLALARWEEEGGAARPARLW